MYKCKTCGKTGEQLKCRFFKIEDLFQCEPCNEKEELAKPNRDNGIDLVEYLRKNS